MKSESGFSFAMASQPFQYPENTEIKHNLVFLPHITNNIFSAWNFFTHKSKNGVKVIKGPNRA